MYEEHFGLSRRPFGETVEPSSYVPLPTREAVLRRLRYGLDEAQGPALLFGPSGTGKTLLARTLARFSGGLSAHLTFPAMPAGELMSFLSDELGAPPGSGTGLGSALRRLRGRLADCAGRGERPLLVVDEAHLIGDDATFEALRAVLNFASLGPPDLRMVLIASPDLLPRLPHALADRLTARCALGPLTRSEAGAYVLGRLAAAGARQPLFDPEAIAVLHRASEGLPRRLNRLADLALLIAFAEGHPCPGPRAVAAAAREAESDPLAA